MKNLKNFAFGLLVAVLAVGFSAFTPEKEAQKRLMYIYANNGTSYVKVTGTASPEDCLDNHAEICLIESDQDRPSGFLYNNKPSDWQPVQDAEEGTYNP